MLGVAYVDIQGPAAPGIAQVVQDPPGFAAPTGLPPAERTTPVPVVPASSLDPGWRQILHPRNPFCDIRNVVTRAVHDRTSRRSASGEMSAKQPTAPQEFATTVLQSRLDKDFWEIG